jgi:hypothetical protein
MADPSRNRMLAALLELVLERRWAQRLEGSRALIFSPAGAAAWATIGR